MCSKTNSVIHTALSVLNVLQKLLFYGQEYRCAAAPSGPLSYCFGITLLLERNLLPFELLLFSWRGISCPSNYFSSLGEKSPAVNRQPGYCSGNSKGRRLPLSISRNFGIFKNSHHFSTFWKSLAPIEL